MKDEQTKRQQRLLKVLAHKSLRSSQKSKKLLSKSVKELPIGAERGENDLDEIDYITPSTLIEISSGNQQKLKQ